jgi:hypothetical protein
VLSKARIDLHKRENKLKLSERKFRGGIRMRKILLIGVVLAVFSVALALSGPTFIGDGKCKMCHKTEHASWAKMKHAKAFDLLKPEEQKDEKCLSCHTTGYGTSDKVLEGVQCEACHGPGSEYKSIKVMKDPEKAKAAGLIEADEKVCVGCHNEKSPTFKGFNYEEAKSKAMHEKKQK